MDSSELQHKRGAGGRSFVISSRARLVFRVLAALAVALVASAAPQAQPAAPRVVTDEVGRTVRMPAEVRRIVSLAPSVTETLYALGLGERIVGVSDSCDYPPEAQTKPKVGGPTNPSLEQIVALRPDLVIATKAINRRETVEELDRLGVPVFTTDPQSVEGVLASIERLASLLAAQDRAVSLLVDLRVRLALLEQHLAGRAPRRVLFVVWHDPLITIGQQTFLADALRRAGAESVVETTQEWPRISLEEVVRLQPEFLVFAGAHDQGMVRLAASLAERPGWRGLEATKQRRLIVISDAVNRPSPRLWEAIEQLARRLHPGAFTIQTEAPSSKHDARPPGSER